MKTATQTLHDIIRRDIETGPHTYALGYGHDWHFLSPAEAEVFRLELHDLPSLVTVWTAYETVLEICDMLDVPADIAAGVRAEHPWLEERRASTVIDVVDFQKFAKLFGVPYRKSQAWYAKHDFWCTRNGITRFADEPPAAPAPSRESAPARAELLDDDIPF